LAALLQQLKLIRARNDKLIYRSKLGLSNPKSINPIHISTHTMLPQKVLHIFQMLRWVATSLGGGGVVFLAPLDGGVAALLAVATPLGGGVVGLRIF
jgi:hypothetical protein